jgi:hypothetical protein
MVKYPAVPPQIPACGITEPDSSNLLSYSLTSVILRVSLANFFKF